MQRRMTIWDRSQQATVEVPFVNGNAIRGSLRRLIMADFLDLVGYKVEHAKLHHALYSGGQLESSDDGAFDMALRRKLIECIPPLGLLGTSVGNQIITGCLSVEHAMPVCLERIWTRDVRERRDYDDDPRWQQPARIFINEHFQTRRDDLRVEREDDEQATQMLVQCECLIPGTLLEHGFVLRNASEVEAGVLGRALELWRQYPVIGGKASGGFGRILMRYDHEPRPEPYLAWCEDNADLAIEALNEIVNPPKTQRKKAKEAEE